MGAAQLIKRINAKIGDKCQKDTAMPMPLTKDSRQALKYVNTFLKYPTKSKYRHGQYNDLVTLGGLGLLFVTSNFDSDLSIFDSPSRVHVPVCQC